jgi:hypothetical protein
MFKHQHGAFSFPELQFSRGQLNFDLAFVTVELVNTHLPKLGGITFYN